MCQALWKAPGTYDTLLHSMPCCKRTLSGAALMGSEEEQCVACAVQRPIPNIAMVLQNVFYPEPTRLGAQQHPLLDVGRG